MSRTNLKLSQDTKNALDEVKKDDETWDECLMRLVQLERATRLATDREGEADSP